MMETTLHTGAAGAGGNPAAAGSTTDENTGAGLRPAAAGSEPPAVWRERRVEWFTGPYAAVAAALPEIVTEPMVNKLGAPHRLTAHIGCRWPAGSPLSTAERRAWSGAPIGAGAAWPPPVQPGGAVEAFCTGMHGADYPEDGDAVLGIAEHGEWYTVRVQRPGPRAAGPGNSKPLLWTALQHDTLSGCTIVDGGVLDPAGGASLPMVPRPVLVENGKLADPGGEKSASEFAAALAGNAETAEKLLTAWSRIPVRGPWLRRWTELYIAPMWGGAAAAEAADEAEARGTDARRIAWIAAAAAKGVIDLEERARLCRHLWTVIEELVRNAPANNAQWRWNSERRGKKAAGPQPVSKAVH